MTLGVDGGFNLTFNVIVDHIVVLNLGVIPP